MEMLLNLHRVLTPVQAALYVVQAFPYHCDAMAPANILMMLVKKDASQADGAGGGAASGGGAAGGSGVMGAGGVAGAMLPEQASAWNISASSAPGMSGRPQGMGVGMGMPGMGAIGGAGMPPMGMGSSLLGMGDADGAGGARGAAGQGGPNGPANGVALGASRLSSGMPMPGGLMPSNPMANPMSDPRGVTMPGHVAAMPSLTGSGTPGCSDGGGPGQPGCGLAGMGPGAGMVAGGLGQLRDSGGGGLGQLRDSGGGGLQPLGATGAAGLGQPGDGGAGALGPLGASGAAGLNHAYGGGLAGMVQPSSAATGTMGQAFGGGMSSGAGLSGIGQCGLGGMMSGTVQPGGMPGMMGATAQPDTVAAGKNTHALTHNNDPNGASSSRSVEGGGAGVNGGGASSRGLQPSPVINSPAFRDASPWSQEQGVDGQVDKFGAMAALSGSSGGMGAWPSLGGCGMGQQSGAGMAAGVGASMLTNMVGPHAPGSYLSAPMANNGGMGYGGMPMLMHGGRMPMGQPPQMPSPQMQQMQMLMQQQQQQQQPGMAAISMQQQMPGGQSVARMSQYQMQYQRGPGAQGQVPTQKTSSSLLPPG
eukprot:357792-Chlamydomonas_euryale.AAC.1